MRVLKIVTATLLALGIAQTYADQTNLVQNVSIQLFGVRQRGTVSNGNLEMTMVDVVRVDTRRTIQAIGEATGHSFSFTAKLVLVSPMNGNAPSFQIRDGTTKVDVSSFFAYEQLTGSVHSLVRNRRNGNSVGTDYSIQRLVLQDGAGSAPLALHFDVNGFARQITVGDRPGADVTMDVSGSGDRNGSLLILQGSIGIFGHQLEVVPEEDPGPIFT